MNILNCTHETCVIAQKLQLFFFTIVVKLWNMVVCRVWSQYDRIWRMQKEHKQQLCQIWRKSRSRSPIFFLIGSHTVFSLRLEYMCTMFALDDAHVPLGTSIVWNWFLLLYKSAPLSPLQFILTRCFSEDGANCRWLVRQMFWNMFIFSVKVIVQGHWETFSQES